MEHREHRWYAIQTTAGHENKVRSLIQRRRSTSSACMIAICPAGPPKLMKPNFSQKRKASRKETGAGRSGGEATVAVESFGRVMRGAGQLEGDDGLAAKCASARHPRGGPRGKIAASR